MKRKTKAFIKLDKADIAFSQAIRLRDKMCVRCYSLVGFNDEGLPVTHQNSHYCGRGKESTRFDLDNCDTLCFNCHIVWGSEDKEGYRIFKIKQLGQQNFNLLLLRSKTYAKKDRLFELIRSKELIKLYFGSN